MSLLKSIDNKISIGNTTTIPLNKNSKFIGIIEEISNYDSIFIIINSDQCSKKNGCKLFFSKDKKNWDIIIKLMI